MIKILFICHGSTDADFQRLRVCWGMRPGDLFWYDRFMTLVKMEILSVVWQMNMWGLENGSQKTAVKFGR